MVSLLITILSQKCLKNSRHQILNIVTKKLLFYTPCQKGCFDSNFLYTAKFWEDLKKTGLKTGKKLREEGGIW